MRVYVAGPYSAPTPEQIEANVARAVEVAACLIAKGHNPFVPHFTHYYDLALKKNHKIEVTYDRWMELDREWLAACEAFFFIAPSPGTNDELIRAASAGKIIWTTLAEVPCLEGGRVLDTDEEP